MIDYINAFFTPNTQNQGNEFTPEIGAKGYDEVLSIDKCSNFDYVATIYESIGYSVDEYITGNPLVHNRYYYDYIECTDIDFNLYVLTTNRIKKDLLDRFLNGIRYWYPDKIAESNLNLGDVCIYDNVEVSN